VQIVSAIEPTGLHQLLDSAAQSLACAAMHPMLDISLSEREFSRLFCQEVSTSRLCEQKSNLQESLFGLFDVLVICLDPFPQPVHPLEKHGLQNHFFDAVKKTSNCLKKPLCIHE
jgi:hypothetical protein